MDEDRAESGAGDLGTFIVRVRRRQNASWQGELVWAEGQQKQYFRSALELLKLVDSALDEAEVYPAWAGRTGGMPEGGARIAPQQFLYRS